MTEDEFRKLFREEMLAVLQDTALLLNSNAWTATPEYAVCFDTLKKNLKKKKQPDQSRGLR